MVHKVNLLSVGSLQDTTTAASTINNNFTTIQNSFDNTLSLNGLVPNQMQNNLDMNSNRILNLPAPSSVNEPLRLVDATNFNGGGIINITNTSNTYYQYPPGGRLTLNSGVSVMTSDVAAATTLYYAPSLTQYILIYNGTSINNYQFTASNTDSVGLSLNLGSSWTASTLYDVFVTLSSGSPILVTGPAWSSSSAGISSRGYSLSNYGGLVTNNSSLTVRNTNSTTLTMSPNQGTYVGTVLINATGGQIDFKFGGLGVGGGPATAGVWNMYNRNQSAFVVRDSVAYCGVGSLNVYQPFDVGNSGGLNNRVTLITGLGTDPVSCKFTCNVGLVSSTQTAIVAIGLNSTSSQWSNCTPSWTSGANFLLTQNAVADGFVPIGLNYIQALYYASSGPVSFYCNSGSSEALSVIWWW